MGQFFNKIFTGLIILGIPLILKSEVIYSTLDKDGFIENTGQIKDQYGEINKDVLYSLFQRGFNVNLKRNSFSYDFFMKSENDSILTHFHHPKDRHFFSYDFHRIDVEFVGANNEIDIDTMGEGILYKEVYDGVDVHFLTANGRFKYNIIVENLQALERVKLNYKGALNLSINSESALSITTDFGDFEEKIPVSYFTRDYHNSNVKELVTVEPFIEGSFLSYKLDSEFKESILVIDPLPHLQWATYLGGEARDEIQASQADSEGNVYVAGFSQSTEGIATTGAHQGAMLGIFNCFLVKYNEEGEKVWGTYYGGTIADRCYGMEFDGEALYLTGSTFSEENIATPGVYQTEIGGQDDAFIAKFNLDGELIWGTYFGGEKHDFFADLGIDSEGNIVATGHTTSESNVATSGAHLEYLPGNENAILAKFTPDGQLLWSTYFGNTFDEGWGVDVDLEDNIYFTGVTSSTVDIASAGVYQENYGGELDAFLVKFNSEGVYQWGTYYGGSQYDQGNDILTHPNGDSYIIGITGSNDNITTDGAFQEEMGSIDDAFLAKFDSDGQIKWGTYIGGNQVDVLNGIVFNLDSMLCMTGYTQSSNNIAVESAFQPEPAGLFDAMLMVFNQEGEYEWGTYFGDVSSDEANAIAVDYSTNHIIIAGYTQSEEGIATAGADQEVYGGGILDGFIARFCIPPFPVLVSSGAFPVCQGATVSFQVEDHYADYTWSVGGNQHILDLEPENLDGYQIYVDVIDTTGCPGYSDTLSVEVLAQPNPEITSESSTLCEGDTVELTTIESYSSYLWSTGAETAWLNTENMSDGTYEVFVTVTGDNGCEGTSEIFNLEIFENPKPIIEAENGFQFCPDSSIELSTQDFESYSWSTGSSMQSIAVSNEGEYWVEVTNDYGCSGFSDTIWVEHFSVTPPAISAYPSNEVCVNHEVELSVNDNFVTYEWSNGEETASITVAHEEPDTIVYSVTVIDENGCETSDEMPVVFDICTYVNRHVSTSKVQLFPNPVSDKLTIQTTENGVKQVRVYNLVGALLHTYEMNDNELTIPTTSMAAGVYLLKVEGGDLRFVERFVVK